MNNIEAKKYIRKWLDIMQETGVISESGGCLSCRIGNKMIFSSINSKSISRDPDSMTVVDLADFKPGKASQLPDSYNIHAAIYRAKSNVKAIIHSVQINTLTSSKAGHVIYPMLDDIAQLIGTSIYTVDIDTSSAGKAGKKVLKALKWRSAVLLAGNGGLCLGNNFDDAHAVSQVLEKACKCEIETTFMGGGHRINPFLAFAMRCHYILSYSKEAEKNR